MNYKYLVALIFILNNYIGTSQRIISNYFVGEIIYELPIIENGIYIEHFYDIELKNKKGEPRYRYSQIYEVISKEKNGLEITFNKNNNKIYCITYFENNSIRHQKGFNPNGRLKYDILFTKNQLSGLAYFYSKRGKLTDIIKYEKDKFKTQIYKSKRSKLPVEYLIFEYVSTLNLKSYWPILME